MSKRKPITIIAIILSVVLLFSSGITANAEFSVPSDEPTVETRYFNMAEFHHIAVGGNWDVTYVEAPTHSIRVEMPEVWFGRYNFNVRSRTLSVERRLLSRFTRWNEPVRPRIYIFAPTLESMNLSGSATAQTRYPIAERDFVLNTSGTAKATLHLYISRNLVLNSSGASYVNLSGTTDTLRITGAGVNRIHAFDLQATEARNVNVAGVGTVEISVTELLDVRVAGTTRVYFRGNPTVNQRVSGSGRVIQVN